jgi:hypothetical protein
MVEETEVANLVLSTLIVGCIMLEIEIDVIEFPMPNYKNR